MSWTVDYAPLAGSYEASAAIVVIPILSLFVLLFLTKVYIAAVVALSGCLIVAIGERLCAEASAHTDLSHCSKATGD